MRRGAPDAETIDQAELTAAERRFLSTVSLRELIGKPETARVVDLTRPEPIFARGVEANARAVRAIRNYDLLAVPVISSHDRLVGIITDDGATNGAEEVETERFGKVSAVATLGVPRARPQSDFFIKSGCLGL